MTPFIIIASIIAIFCFIIAPQFFHIFFSPPLNTITYTHVIMDIVCYTITDMILLYGGGIIMTCYYVNELKKLKIPTLIPSDILQVISLLSGIPMIAYHLGYPIPNYIGIATYSTINTIIAYIPKYTYNRVATHKKFNDIFQQLSAHTQVETMRQFGHKTSQNTRISYTQKQKFIQHHESSSIPHTP